MNRGFLAFMLGTTFAGPAAAQSALAEIDQARLEAAFTDARAAVESALAVRFDPALGVRVVPMLGLADRLAAENLPIVKLRQSDPEKALAEARRIGLALAPRVFAKYAWSRREVLAVPEVWREQAKMSEQPGLTSDAGLRAVLVHELVHAADYVKYELEKTLARLRTTDAVDAFSGVFEGHAQHVARRVCAERGWSAGFDAFSATTSALPRSLETLDAFSQQLIRIQAASSAMAYVQGERFIAAIEAARGAEGIASAYRQPPLDVETLFHPEWFLDPSTRPPAWYDAAAALTLFERRFPEDVWTRQRSSAQAPQLEAALSLLPAETVRRVRDSLRANRFATVFPTTAPASKMAVLGLLEFDSTQSARAYLEAVAELHRLRDEKMKKGVVRILSSKSIPIADADLRGSLVRRRMATGLLEFDVTSLSLARGRLAIETVFSGEPIEDGDHVALAREALDRAIRKGEPEEKR